MSEREKSLPKKIKMKKIVGWTLSYTVGANISSSGKWFVHKN